MLLSQKESSTINQSIDRQNILFITEFAQQLNVYSKCTVLYTANSLANPFIKDSFGEVQKKCHLSLSLCLERETILDKKHILKSKK